MSRTTRRTMYDVKYLEGTHGHLRRHKCKCDGCTCKKFKDKKTVSVDEAMKLADNGYTRPIE